MLDSGWAAAVAAFRQLRHGRNAKDIVVYLRLIDFMDSPGTVAVRQSLQTIAAKVATDPDYRERLGDRTFVPDEFQNVGEMLRFLEHISVLVTKGAESLVLAEYADVFVEMWERLRVAIERRRVAIGPYTGRAFEHLAIRARAYIDSGRLERDYAVLERDTRAFERPCAAWGYSAGRGS